MRDVSYFVIGERPPPSPLPHIHILINDFQVIGAVFIWYNFNSQIFDGQLILEFLRLISETCNSWSGHILHFFTKIYPLIHTYKHKYIDIHIYKYTNSHSHIHTYTHIIYYMLYWFIDYVEGRYKFLSSLDSYRGKITITPRVSKS